MVAKSLWTRDKSTTAALVEPDVAAIGSPKRRDLPPQCYQSSCETFRTSAAWPTTFTLRQMREKFPALWMGVNFLAVTGKDAFPVLGKLQRDGIAINGYWADDARIDEQRKAMGPRYANVMIRQKHHLHI